MVTKIVLPNVRKLFITDPNYIQYEADLKGADAQVVAWEANDDDLKAAFRLGLDVHSVNAEAMWGPEFTRLGAGTYARNKRRQDCKRGVHLTNYGGSARGMAQALGWTVHESERFQTRWFALHPGIRQWHNRYKSQLASNRTIVNAFGFRRVFFGRIDSCFTEALAWTPQSTVALNTYRGALQLEAKYWPHQARRGYVPPTGDYSGILLQTHDSLNFQFHLESNPMVSEIRKALEVVIPYPDPLVIPWDLKSSLKSWGEMEKAS
jgi:DNA polymerase-1